LLSNATIELHSQSCSARSTFYVPQGGLNDN
jgi:hypothetical protein